MPIARKKRAAKRAAGKPATKAPRDPFAEQIAASDLTLHELFAQQTGAMLERTDLSDEQKQSILIGMSCPCCGAGGFSFTAKLTRKS